jgi:hypothetical protein
VNPESYAAGVRLLEAYNEGFVAGRACRPEECPSPTNQGVRMQESSEALQRTREWHPRSFTIVGAFLAFAIANLIHNDFSVDPAIAPALVVGLFYWWRPLPGLLWATALMIALPSFLFLKPSALTDPANARAFANHLALALAGTLAVVSVLRGLLAGRSRAGKA